MATKGLIMFVAGSSAVLYIAIASFFPDEKKIKKLDRVDKSAVSPGGKISPAEIIRIASSSDKPIYRLNKKEIDDLIQTDQKK